MLKKFTQYINLIMEDLKLNEDYKLNDDEIIYKDITLAIVPGSFKPPHKGHWEMIMNYVNKADKVLILISNISTKAISSRPLSMVNLKKLTKIKDFIENNKLNDDEIKNILNSLNSNIDNLNFDLLKTKLFKLEKICDTKSKENNIYIELKALISSYETKLNDKLFKSIRKAGNKEITPETSKEIFDIFINAYNLGDKIISQVSESASPITDTLNIINYKCKNCKILLGVSEKGDDNSRWNNINKSIKNNTVEVIPSPVSVKTMLSATDIRNNISNLQKDYFPEQISNEDFEKINKLLN